MRPGCSMLALALTAGLAFNSTALAGSKTIAESRILTAEEAIGLSQAAIGGLVGDHKLIDPAGSRFSLNDMRGKPLVISLIYTSCSTVCPVMTQTLHEAVAQANAVIGADRFNVLTVGFDATKDTPARMALYAADQDIDLANWRLASGSKTAISGLLRDVGFSYGSVAGGFDHIAQTTIIDQDGIVYRHVYGDDFPVQVLMEPLKDTVFGLKRDITIGGLVDRFRFFCTSFDPTVGRYVTNYTEAFVGMGVGGLSLILIGFWIVREWRKHRTA